MKQQRPYVLPCRVFGGRSPKTGERVGTRHRWDGGKWGEGRCVYCGHSLEEVLKRQESIKRLLMALCRCGHRYEQHDYGAAYQKPCMSAVRGVVCKCRGYHKAQKLKAAA